MWLLKTVIISAGIFALFFVPYMIWRSTTDAERQSSLLSASPYKLVWSDEFNDKELNSSEWSYDIGCDGWGNNELQCYNARRRENVRLENGTLVIQARIEEFADNGFTSGRIKSKNSWKFGRFEARARLPVGYQLWPAIWMLPANHTYGVWAASGEIDIIEARGNDPKSISGSIHYGGQWPNNSHSGSGERKYDNVDFSKNFHVFGIEWTPEAIAWTLDGVKFHQENIDRMLWSGRGKNPYQRKGQPFDQPFYFIINLAVGGNFFGPGPYIRPETAARNWTQPMLELDWIRVYQLNKSLA